MVLLYEDFDGESFQTTREIRSQLLYPFIAYSAAGLMTGLVLGVILRGKG